MPTRFSTVADCAKLTGVDAAALWSAVDALQLRATGELVTAGRAWQVIFPCVDLIKALRRLVATGRIPASIVENYATLTG